ncbi:MAG TPA: molybdate ABC transporter substrate-binding protein [Thermodesulfobacteriota bacterium]
MHRRTLIGLLVAVGLPVAGVALPRAPAGAAPAPTLTVFGASDLAFAFEAIVPRFERATGARVTLVLGSTGNLAKQIENGAPADAFFAANVGFVDALAASSAVRPESRTLYARGRIVLATTRRSGLRLSSLTDLRRPEVKRIAIANPEHAPYGQAAREALETAGLWDEVRPRLVYGENIRHTLQYLQSGAVEAAIVALSIADVPGIDSVPIDASLHRPIDQAAAVTTRSRQPDLALAFIRFVTGPEGRPIMERYGFALPPSGGS